MGGPLPVMYWDGLRRSGWVRSARLGSAVDRNGQPLPWYTYGAIDFLNERVPSSARVFEYGAGQSTRWYAQRVGEVVSVETDGEWATRIAGHGLPNVRILHRPEVDSYITEVERNEGPFDIIVIDGVERLRCAEAAVSQLTPSGILVWDNSDEPVFQTAREQIAEVRALREVRFTGFGPCCTWTWSTSILYRPGNCLGL